MNAAALRTRGRTWQHCLIYELYHLFDFLLDFTDQEGASLDLVEAHGVHKELGPQQHRQLTSIQLGHENFLVALDSLGGVPRHGIEVPKMSVCHLGSFAPGALDRREDRAVGAAPADHEQ